MFTKKTEYQSKKLNQANRMIYQIFKLPQNQPEKCKNVICTFNTQNLKYEA